jgi:PAS domain S-box-containing protein/putative nucleotidyltransferase with HDIG domain
MMAMKYKILIVEDSPTQAEELKHLLERDNYEVEVAINGLEALNVLEGMKPLVVISDIVMPVMDGYELCRRIKDTENIRDISVILLTSLSEPEDVIESLACGADYFLTKPYDERGLLTRIQYIIANCDLESATQTKVGIEIIFGNQRYYINSDRLQILNLLLSTYETAVQKKRELTIVQGDLLKEIGERQRVEEEIKRLNEELEQRVIERTSELTTANQQLHDEITERKLAEEALKQSEEKYRSLVVNLNDVIDILNAEGFVTYISPVIERFAGYKTEEIIGQPFISYVHPEDQQGLLESLRRTLSGQVEPAEFRLLRKDGTSIYVRSFSRVLAENGQVSLTGVLSDITERKRAEDELRESHGKLAKTFEQTVESLASIAEMRDPYTAGHQVRVAKLARAIASELGMSDEQVEAIRTAALLHDIGKIIVPSEILNKPGKLNALERSFVEAHAQASYEILKTIEFEFPIAEIILQHHEKLDGSGFPRGLSGDSILKEARVLVVADVIEAMASHRPYRPALPLKTALEEISSHRGTLYDADVVDVCLRLFLEKGFRQLIWH